MTKRTLTSWTRFAPAHNIRRKNTAMTVTMTWSTPLMPSPQSASQTQQRPTWTSRLPWSRARTATRTMMRVSSISLMRLNRISKCSPSARWDSSSFNKLTLNMLLHHITRWIRPHRGWISTLSIKALTWADQRAGNYQHLHIRAIPTISKQETWCSNSNVFYGID